MKLRNTLHMIMLTLAFLIIVGLLGIAPTYAQSGCETQIGNYNFPVVGLATFDNLDDGNRAVIVGLSNGDVREIFFRPSDPSQRGDSSIYRIYYSIRGVRLTALSGYYAKDTGYRVVLIGTSDGQIIEVKYHPFRPKLVQVIASFPGKQVVALSSYYYGVLGIRARTAVGLSDGAFYGLEHYTDDHSTGSRNTQFIGGKNPGGGGL